MLLSWYNVKVNLIHLCESAKTVTKNIMKKKTLIGRVVCINQNGAEKCGGVAESEARTNLAANSASMRLKTITKTMSCMTPQKWNDNVWSSYATLSVFAVNNLATQLRTVTKTPTWKRWRAQNKNTAGLTTCRPVGSCTQTQWSVRLISLRNRWWYHTMMGMRTSWIAEKSNTPSQEVSWLSMTIITKLWITTCWFKTQKKLALEQLWSNRQPLKTIITSLRSKQRASPKKTYRTRSTLQMITPISKLLLSRRNSKFKKPKSRLNKRNYKPNKNKKHLRKQLN